MARFHELLRSRRFLLGVVLFFLILSFIPTAKGPLVEVLAGQAGGGWVRTEAAAYLETQRERALEGFLAMSALKAGLAILRSSEIGLILNVKIGDLAIAVYDYVNFGWKVLLAAVVYFHAAGFLLDLAQTVDIWFLWLFLICAGLALLSGIIGPPSARAGSLFSRTAAASFTVALILYLAFPLVFVGAGWVSVHITGSPIEEANRVMEDLRREMPQILEKEGAPTAAKIRTYSVTVPVPYEGEGPAVVEEDTGGKTGVARVLAGVVPTHKLKELGNLLESRSRALASAVIRQAAAYLFNIVVFPLLMILGLYWGARFLISLGTPSRS